jgi:hypothetical protein
MARRMEHRTGRVVLQDLSPDGQQGPISRSRTPIRQ